MNISFIKEGVVFLTDECLDILRKLFTPEYSNAAVFAGYVRDPDNWKLVSRENTDSFHPDGPGKILRDLQCRKISKLHFYIVTDVSDTRVFRHGFGLA